MKRNATKYDINTLIEEMVKPCAWKDHVKDDLMKFWDRPEITAMKDGLFPTYITNSGEPLSNDMEQ